MAGRGKYQLSAFQAAVSDIGRILVGLPQNEREQATTDALGDVAGVPQISARTADFAPRRDGE